MKRWAAVCVICVMILSCTGCLFFDREQSKEEIIGNFRQNYDKIASSVERIEELYASQNRDVMRVTMLEGDSARIVWTDYFPADTEEIAVVQEDPLLHQVLELVTVREIRVEKDVIEFKGEGSGMGSNTSYCGIFYTPDDDLTASSYYDYHMTFTEEENVLVGELENSDNTFYAERIEPCFFYYRAKY